MKRNSAWAIALSWGLAAASARAQSVGQCAPNATTPPLLNQTTANWGTPTFLVQSGSFTNDDELRVRVDKANRAIFVSWTVNTSVDISNMTSPEFTYIGIGNGNTTTSNGVLFKIDVLASNPPPTNHEADLLSGSTGGGTLVMKTINGATEGAFAPGADASYADPTPPATGAPTGTRGAWLNVTPVGGNCSGPGPCSGIYNIEMRIPTHAGAPQIDANGTIQVDSLDSFSFWSQTAEPLPANHQSVVAWPISIINYGGTIHYDNASGFGAIGIDGWNMMFTAAPQVAECQNGSNTVVLDANFLGRVDPASPNNFITTMQLFGPAATPKTSQTLQSNRVMAYVFNGTTQPIQPSDLQVNFNFATWGSQAGAFVPLDAGGNDVTVSGGVKSYGTGVNAPSVVQGGGAIPPGGFAPVYLDWTAAMSYACQFHDDTGTLLDTIYVGNGATTGPAAQCKGVNPAVLPTTDALQLHQCVKAVAHSKSNAFADSAPIQRNMDFVTASRFRRTAAIDTKGLKPIPGKNGHDIYLYLELRNMPSVYKDGGHVFTFPQGVELASAVKNRAASTAWRATFPTYTVHVYHDTGRRVKSGGKHPRTVDILEPQQSFGYYVAHTGNKMFGWRPTLSGPGLVQIAPNFWRVNIPNGKRAMVQTGVDALERPCLTKDCRKEWDEHDREWNRLELEMKKPPMK